MTEPTISKIIAVVTIGCGWPMAADAVARIIQVLG